MLSYCYYCYFSFGLKGHWRFPSGKEMQGYAYILTHPGTPSVFHDHIFSEYQSEISALISVRKRNKIHCRSIVSFERFCLNWLYQLLDLVFSIISMVQILRWLESTERFPIRYFLPDIDYYGFWCLWPIIWISSFLDS